ncbi:MAG: hypothetical protein MSC30_11065 [Gaiellaceae bacterium MAG52_C11]|nr:hypothetical protein [Candidatus Gaiellasilicea maunaloa]
MSSGCSRRPKKQQLRRQTMLMIGGLGCNKATVAALTNRHAATDRDS